MDGPMVKIVAPCGRLAAIHCPASRPPGSPPDPARKVVLADGLMVCQVGMAMVAHTMAIHAVVAAARRAADILPVSFWRASFSWARSTASAAQMASTGAMGSRYWNPLIGRSE